MADTKTNSRYRLVESLYQAAVDLPADQRAAFIAEKTAGDAELRGELEALLRHHELAGDDYLAKPVHALSMSGIEAPLPKRIGRYDIVRVIGEGGMGTVFEARQENPQRSVAVKVIRAGLPSADALRRFENEAQILGRLQHSGIAHIYEAGMADFVSADDAVSRQPFFAMEFVQGKPLSEYATGLLLADRLGLFLRICEAVDYAHQAGAIHRDLKPANILITPGGEPKVLDFGVARMIDPDVQITTVYTDLSHAVGTLPYMSPEQVDRSAEQIDARSDVYALGVILYELIAGRLPYDLSGMPITRAARVIVEDPPASLASVDRSFQGDLETIVGKVLEKEPFRRYRSAAALADDVRRYLNREPISARPSGTVYQFRKFAQRNTALVVSIVAAFVALLAGVVGTTTFALRERAQAANARHRAAQAQAVTDFLREMIATVDPVNARGAEVSVREALDEAARRLTNGELTDNPEVEASLRITIGETYNSLGHPKLALSQLEAAIQILDPLLDENHPDAINGLAELAESYRGLGEYEEAERRQRVVLEKSLALYGEGHLRVADALEPLAITLEKVERNDEAKAISYDALAIRRQHSRDDPRALARSLAGVGALQTKLGNLDEAESLLKEALAIRRASLPMDHPELAASISNLGSLYYEQGKLARAEPLLTEAVAMRKRVLEPSHPDLLESMNRLAVLLIARGQGRRALPLLQEIVQTQRSNLGDDHPDLGKSLLSLAFALLAESRWDEAERAGQEGIENIRQAFGDRHPNLAMGMHNLAVQYMRLGQVERALPLLQDSTAMIVESLGDDHPLAAHCRDTLGALYLWKGQYDEAVELLERSSATRREKLGPDHGKLGITCKNLAAARLGRKEYSAAATAAQQAVDILNDALFMEYNDAVLLLAESRIRLGESTVDSEKDIAKAIDELKTRGGPWWMVADGRRVMGLWLADQGRPEDAVEELGQAQKLLNCDKEINPFACQVVLERINRDLNSLDQ